MERYTDTSIYLNTHICLDIKSAFTFSLITFGVLPTNIDKKTKNKIQI